MKRFSVLFTVRLMSQHFLVGGKIGSDMEMFGWSLFFFFLCFFPSLLSFLFFFFICAVLPSPVFFYRKVRHRHVRLPDMTPEEDDSLAQYFFDYPENTVEEASIFLSAQYGRPYSNSSLLRSLHRSHISHKVLTHHASQAILAEQLDFLAKLYELDPDQIVTLDESGSDRRNFRRHRGWATSGRRAVLRSFWSRGQRYSLIVALSCSKVLCYWPLVGTYNKATYSFFLTSILIPSILASGIRNPVLVLDNINFHHYQPFISLLESYGIRCLFLPRYSPTFNPTEFLFRQLKGFLRTYGHQLEETGHDMYQMFAIFFAGVTSSHCLSHFLSAFDHNE